MNRRKLSPFGKCVLIGICLIVFFVLIENMINSATAIKKEIVIKKEQDEAQKEYEKTPEYEQEVYIEKSIEETMKLLNSEDYDALLQHVEPRYRFCMGIGDVEDLKAHITQTYGEPQNIELVDFYTAQGRYNCTVMVDLENEIFSKSLIVIPLEDDNFSLMFDNITGIEEYPHFSSYADSRMAFKLKYKMKRKNDYIMTFDIVNRTSQTITGSLEKTYVRATNTKEYKIYNQDDLKNITLGPNETKTLLYKVDVSDKYYTEDDTVNFVFTEPNGKETRFPILMTNLHY